VRGGVGGTAARLDDLDVAAHLLRQAGSELAAIAAAALRVARDPVLLASFLVSAGTAAQAEAALLLATAGPSGVAVAAARSQALGVALGAAVLAYRAADDSAAGAVHVLDHAFGQTVGRLAAAGVVVTPGSLPLLGVVTGLAVAAPTLAGVMSAVAPSSAPASADAGADLPAAAAQLLPPSVLEAGNRFLELLARHTSAVERAVDVAGGVVDGVLDIVPGGLPGLAAVMPLLHESGHVRVTAGPLRDSRAPAGLAEVISRVAASSPGTPTADGRLTPAGTVRVDQVRGADGRRAWIVEIPGTHRWSPLAGGDPFDLTADVHTLARDSSAAGATVLGALRAAGARADEPVLLAGHSLGGMVAAQLAADPAVRREFRITHVVTAGSPVAVSGVPDDVQVLSLEHTDDLVPRLDGVANPDRPNWVTVSRPATALAAGLGAAALDVGGRDAEVHPRLVVTHAADSYTSTAAMVDASTDPSLVEWRRGLVPFLDRPGATARTWEVVGERRPS
jgi:hypothetical protein